MKSFLTIILLLELSSGFSQENSNKDFYQKNDSINLYAFIGQKISVTEFDPNKNRVKKVEIDSLTGDTLRINSAYYMDHAFNSKYKIIQSVFNDLKTDTIDFVTYDHYGRPGFEKYEFVILYISRSEDGKYFFHQKYQFDPVIKNKKKNWKGENGKSIAKLFKSKKEAVFKARGIFK